MSTKKGPVKSAFNKKADIKGCEEGTREKSPVGCTSNDVDTAAFMKWCARNKVKFPSCAIGELPETGRCILATKNITKGDVVVELPDAAVLMVEHCSIGCVLEVEGLSKPAENEILEVQGLVLAVMFEKSLGSSSHWAPYLRLLPENVTHLPFMWKRREARELLGTAAMDKMMGRVQHPADAPTQVSALWLDIAEPFLQNHPELGLPTGEAGFALYCWSTAVVSSYSFQLGDDKYQAMVPVWDLLNHVTGAVNVKLHHCAKRGLLQMIATQDIAAGEEAVNCYGELSNAELLRAYGFVEPLERNFNNHLQVPLALVRRAARQRATLPTKGTEAAGPGFKRLANQVPDSGSAAPAKKSRSSGGTTTPAGNGGAAAVPPPSDSAPPVTLAGRILLARRLRLVPPTHVFKIHRGKPVPGPLLALLALLELPPSDAESVWRVLSAQGRVAALRLLRELAGVPQIEGATLESSSKVVVGRESNNNKPDEVNSNADSKKSGGKKGKGKAAKKENEGKEITTTKDGKDGAATSLPSSLASTSVVASSVSAMLVQVARLMLSRYTCSLAEDRGLMGRYGELPEHLQAALLARIPEKEILEDIVSSVAGGDLAATLDVFLEGKAEEEEKSRAGKEAKRKGKGKATRGADGDDDGDSDSDDEDEDSSDGDCDEDEEEEGCGHHNHCHHPHHRHHHHDHDHHGGCGHGHHHHRGGCCGGGGAGQASKLGKRAEGELSKGNGKGGKAAADAAAAAVKGGPQPFSFGFSLSKQS